MAEHKMVVPFFGKDDVFSNFFVCGILIDGKSYSCTEQYYQSQKAEFFGDLGTYRFIMDTVVQREMKHLGARVRRFNARSWQSQKVAVMRRALDAKFRQHQSLADFLLDTGDSYLVEANPSDYFWGVGMAKTDEDIGVVDCHQGANMMGRLLMDLRGQLRSERAAAEAVVLPDVPGPIGALGEVGLNFGQAHPGRAIRRTRRGGRKHYRRRRNRAARRSASLQGPSIPAHLDFL